MTSDSGFAALEAMVALALRADEDRTRALIATALGRLDRPQQNREALLEAVRRQPLVGSRELHAAVAEVTRERHDRGIAADELRQALQETLSDGSLRRIEGPGRRVRYERLTGSDARPGARSCATCGQLIPATSGRHVEGPEVSPHADRPPVTPSPAVNRADDTVGRVTA